MVAAVEPRRIGRAIVELGGGRMAVEDAVDPTVGFVITVKPGDPVRAGEPIASIFARDDAGIALGIDRAARGRVHRRRRPPHAADLAPDHGARRRGPGGGGLTCRS